MDVEVELDVGEGTPIVGRTLNVSRGGLCILVDRHVEPGTEISAKLSLVFSEEAMSEAIHVPVRSVWSTAIADDFQIGLAYANLTPEQRESLDLVLHFLSKRNSGA